MSVADRPASNDLIALCLSGGGYRAALFHLGAVRRLNELGVLSKISTIVSVSGGSILAAHLASTIKPWPQPGASVDLLQFEKQVEIPFRQFVKRNIRTWPVLKRLLFPWELVPIEHPGRNSRIQVSRIPDTDEFDRTAGSTDVCVLRHRHHERG